MKLTLTTLRLERTNVRLSPTYSTQEFQRRYSLQLDISKEDTDEIERELDKRRSAGSSMDLFYLNVNIDLAIKHA